MIPRHAAARTRRLPPMTDRPLGDGRWPLFPQRQLAELIDRHQVSGSRAPRHDSRSRHPRQ